MFLIYLYLTFNINTNVSIYKCERKTYRLIRVVWKRTVTLANANRKLEADVVRPVVVREVHYILEKLQRLDGA